MQHILILGQERGIYRWEATLASLNTLPGVITVYIPRKSVSGITSAIERVTRGFKILLALFKVDSVWLLPMSDADLWVLAIAKVLRKHIYIDFYSSRLEVATNNGRITPRGGPAVRKLVFYYLADWLRIHLGDTVIFLTQAEATQNVERYRLTNVKKIAVVPLVVPSLDGAKRARATEAPFKASLNIVWWGGISKLHNLRYVIDEVNRVEADCILWLFDSGEQRIKEFKTVNSDLDLAKVRFRSDLTFEEGLWPWVDRNSDVILGVFGDTKVAAAVVPNKVIQAAHFGQPIITRKNELLQSFAAGAPGLNLIDVSEGELSARIDEIALRRTGCREIYSTLKTYYSEDAFQNRLRKLLRFQ